MNEEKISITTGFTRLFQRSQRYRVLVTCAIAMTVGALMFSGSDKPKPAMNTPVAQQQAAPAPGFPAPALPGQPVPGATSQIAPRNALASSTPEPLALKPSYSLEGLKIIE